MRDPKRHNAPCAICGEATGYNRTQAPANPMHRGCRPPKPTEHGTANEYWRGCRCVPCRDANQLYRDARSWRKPLFVIVCRGCGLPAQTTERDGVYCSLSCTMRARGLAARQHLLPVLHPNPDPASLLPSKHPARRPLRRRSEWWKLIVSGPCLWCGEVFTGLAASASTAPKYCSDRCLTKAGRATSHRLRGRFQPSQRTRHRIYDRDKWTCQLCHDPVDPDATDEWRASLDHIVPQSHQLIPDHSDRNLRLTHFWCNWVRSDARVPDEWFAA